MRNYVILILTAIVLSNCADFFKGNRYGSYNDRLEDLTGVENKISGKSERFKVGDLPQIQRDTVRSGKNALKLDPSFPYGLNYTLPDVRTDEFVEVSVWCSGPGQLVLVGSHKDAKYFYRKGVSKKIEGDGWQEVKLEMSIPPSMNKEDLNIYVWNPGKEPVYADDFSINYKEFKSYPDYQANEGIHLLIDTMDMLRLEQKRNQAFTNGILETEDDDYVSGIMYYNDSIMPVDIRLKGDWLDHLEGRKWSFRIKLKKSNTWKNVRTFSIHTPIARDFLNEYVSHELFRDNDLLSPRYGFVPLTLNGTSLGIYAWEEHFDKQLIEAMNRREGPILKFDESLFWQTQKVFIQDSKYFELPFLEAADIVPFKLGRTLESETLRNNFYLGHNLLNQYRNGLKQASDIFDVDKLAGYFAMMDLTRGFHGEAWHNQRYYYNPVIGKLEPIFFDAYTELGVFNPEQNAISGLFDFNPEGIKRFENLAWVRIFQDKKFQQKYYSWLEKVSDPVWLSDFLQDIEKDISKYEELIKAEYPEYNYDRGFLLENARKIRVELPYYKEKIDTDENYADFNLSDLKFVDYSKEYDPRFPANYLNAYLSDSVDNRYLIHVDNFYPMDIELVGYGETEKIVDGVPEKKIVIPAFVNNMPDSEVLEVDKVSKYLFFKVRGKDERIAIPILPYPNPSENCPQQELFKDEISYPDFISVIGSTFTFKTGKHVVEEKIVIREGFIVMFQPGCQLDFINESFLISRSPVFVKGEANNPVVIMSSDSSAMGFNVLQAGGISELEYVVFSSFNTLNYKGWSLTGAVNFYESDVVISNVEFRENVCEDALNIIRSDFTVRSSKFYDTFADAFDSDFCTGRVEDVTFEKIGNDAIDFSGSQVDIVSCQISEAGDKGVSAGEGSTLNVSGTSVDVANIAFASKDNSVLTLDDCSANKTRYGLLAFQKKPEYGPGNIKTKRFNAADVEILYLIERFSKLSLNGSFVLGKETGVANLFY